MEIDSTESGGVRVLKLRGDIRTEDSRLLASTFERLLEDGDLDMVLEMAEVGYVTSAALGHIVGLAAVLRRRGGNLAVCALAPEVRKSFAVTRIDKVVEVAASLGAALDTLKRMSSAR
jgi:anti-anti-sigma factor